MRAHPPDADPDRMPANEPTNGDREPPLHEIRVRGPIGETIMLAFPTLTATRHEQDTLLVGSLADQCALYGAIHQLEALGLQLLEVRRLAAHPDDEQAAPATPMDDEQGLDDV
jgi:hypothetical protein